MKLKLIGVNTCPYVQRSLILFYLKKIDFEFISVDLQNKPSWFVELSPTGKVPILQIDNKLVFESLVINELIDEMYGDPLIKLNPVEKAINRSWSEYASGLLMTQFAMTRAEDEDQYQSLFAKLKNNLNWMEQSNINLPYFNGADFSLIDIAVAPLFLRLNLLEKYYDLKIFESQKIKDWSNTVCKHDAVKGSVSSDYEQILLNNLMHHGGFISNFLKESATKI